MKSILRFVAPFILFVVASICIFHAEGFQQQQTTSSSSLRPMTPKLDLEESILLSRELEWAEHAMEAFQRKNNGQYPLRSSISAMHVHTNELKQASAQVLMTSQ